MYNIVLLYLCLSLLTLSYCMQFYSVLFWYQFIVHSPKWWKSRCW